MADNFNTYFHHIDPDFWRELCVNEGKLLRLEKGEEFVSVGSVGRYIGYIHSGTLKLVAYSENGIEHVVGMHSGIIYMSRLISISLFGKSGNIAIIPEQKISTKTSNHKYY